MAEFHEASVANRATIPGAIWRRRRLAAAIVVGCVFVGLVFSALQPKTFASTARIVVEDPARNSQSVLAAAISPDRYVDDQVAVFDLQILAQLASDIVNDTLTVEANERNQAATVVGSAANVTLGEGGAVNVGPAGADLSLRADGSIRSGPAAGLRIDAEGAVRRADNTQLLSTDGQPLAVGRNDLVVVRSDGLAVLLPAGKTPIIVVPGGDVIEDVARAGVAGLSLDADGTTRVRYGRRTVALGTGVLPRVIGIDGLPITRPDNGEPVGTGANRILLDGSGDGTGVFAGAGVTVVVDTNGSTVVAGSDGQVMSRSPDAVIGDGQAVDAVEVVRMDPDLFAAGLSVSAREGTNLIEVTFSSGQPELARIGANAAVDAYRKLRQSNSAGANADAVARADGSIAALTLQLTADERELTTAKGTPARTELAAQYDTILERLAAAGRELLADTTGTGTAANRIRNLQLQLDLIRGLDASDNTRPEIAEIISRRDLTRTRLEQVQTQRDNLLIDAQRAASGVTLFSPAPAASDVAGLGSTRLSLAALIAGVFLAAVVTYVLESRRNSLEDPDDVAAILGAPLLGEIPDYRHERLKGDLPVLSDPTTFAAEAYRIVAAALVLGSDRRGSLVGVVSAGVGQGKTSVAANVSVVLAQSQQAILAVDADLDGQVLTLMLGRLRQTTVSWRGLSDVLVGDVPFDEVTTDIPVDSEGTLELVGAGSERPRARSLFDTGHADDLFGWARENFDTVLVDLPPVLNVAYAARALHRLDGALVVVPKGLRSAELRELADRLQLIGTPVLGFVLTRTSLRADRTPSVAALHHNLGGHVISRRVWSRRRRRQHAETNGVKLADS